PAAERRLEPPAQLTPEWVNANATYVYLPRQAPDDKPLTRAAAKGRGDPIMLHAPLQEVYDIRMFCAGGGCRRAVSPMIDLAGELSPGPREWIEKKIEESKDFLRAARHGKLIEKDGFPQAPSELKNER